MPCIALQGIRGGTGTTALTAALAWALAKLNEKVLIIDFSPINLLRLYFNMSFDQPRGWARAMTDNHPWTQSAMRYSPSLDFLPFGRTSLAEQCDLEKKLLLSPQLWLENCSQLIASKKYQWILFDLPYDNSSFATQALTAAHKKLLILNPDSNCYTRLYQQALPKDCDMLLNKYNASHSLQHDILSVWQAMLPRLLPIIIHEDASMAESLAMKQPLGEYCPHSRSAEEMINLAGWCLIHFGEQTHE